MHFAVPLLLEQTVLVGYILAGQVFDQYPETLLLQRAAREYSLSAQEVWNVARQAHPISAVSLQVYADLLTTLANALLQAQYFFTTKFTKIVRRVATMALEHAG